MGEAKDREAAIKAAQEEERKRQEELQKLLATPMSKDEVEKAMADSAVEAAQLLVARQKLVARQDALRVDIADTQAQIDNRMKMIDEGDQKLTIEKQRLYQDVMDKKVAYDAALTGFTAAEMSRGAAERQYQNGLISELQYVGSQISYHQKKAAKEAAELSLWQAMETYDWGVIGLATVE